MTVWVPEMWRALEAHHGSGVWFSVDLACCEVTEQAPPTSPPHNGLPDHASAEEPSIATPAATGGPAGMAAAGLAGAVYAEQDALAVMRCGRSGCTGASCSHRLSALQAASRAQGCDAQSISCPAAGARCSCSQASAFQSLAGSCSSRTASGPGLRLGSAAAAAAAACKKTAPCVRPQQTHEVTVNIRNLDLSEHACIRLDYMHLVPIPASL